GPVSENLTHVAFVYFDLETGGFSYNDDILQIAMKSASSIHGLTKNGTELLFRGKAVSTLSKKIVFGQVLQFLTQLNKPCILIGHNAKTFDIPRLIILISQVNLGAEFSKIPFPNAHDAYADVCMLQQLTLSLFTNDKLIAEYFTFSTAMSNLRNLLNSRKTEKTLAPLQKILSFYTIKQIASAGIDLDTLRQKFTEHGEAELVKFLQNARSAKGKPKKRGNVLPMKQINFIIQYFKK
ncbi:hypothetical protein PV327_011173, partial [Microctonus hyperodae]